MTDPFAFLDSNTTGANDDPFATNTMITVNTGRTADQFSALSVSAPQQQPLANAANSAPYMAPNAWNSNAYNTASAAMPQNNMYMSSYNAPQVQAQPQASSFSTHAPSYGGAPAQARVPVQSPPQAQAYDPFSTVPAAAGGSGAQNNNFGWDDDPFSPPPQQQQQQQQQASDPFSADAWDPFGDATPPQNKPTNNGNTQSSYAKAVDLNFLFQGSSSSPQQKPQQQTTAVQDKSAADEKPTKGKKKKKKKNQKQSNQRR
mmetsp:Transcript_14857/g.22401  ORF Transcript_14857/g.22401 Transcript_14857/m.22401 type:complete len:259 (-) Transcript_14857:713-1489(-)